MGKDSPDAETLIQHADAALYYAKNEGRNNYQFYKESLSQKNPELLKLEKNLRHAMKRKELMLYYQPRVNITTGKITRHGGFIALDDDGLVHVTRDGANTWTNVTPKGLEETLINSIEVSPHDKATAYLAATRYKWNDFSPSLYKTTDYGKTWTKIVNGIPDGAYTRVIREDDQRKDLLYAGTETGLYISYNGGANWAPFQFNLPVTPITDLKVHQNDLIAATMGRSIWILDDLAPVRQYRSTIEKDSLWVYTPEASYRVSGRSRLDKVTDGESTGKEQSGHAATTLPPAWCYTISFPPNQIPPCR